MAGTQPILSGLKEQKLGKTKLLKEITLDEDEC